MLENPLVTFNLRRYNLLRTGIPEQTSRMTNDIRPMLQKNSKKIRCLYWKNGNGVYWIYFP